MVTCKTSTIMKDLERTINQHLQSVRNNTTKVFSAFINYKDAHLTNWTINTTMSQFTKKTGTHFVMNLLPMHPKSIQPLGSINIRAADLV